jgi:uncharacterized protein (TIGR02996 family)
MSFRRLSESADRDALRQAIEADPLDLEYRLVYADWCEEHGDDKEARFQRSMAAWLRVWRESGRRPNTGDFPQGSTYVVPGRPWFFYVEQPPDGVNVDAMRVTNDQNMSQEPQNGYFWYFRLFYPTLEHMIQAFRDNFA